MKELTYNERIAVMRILKDIILADNRIDEREQLLFSEIAKTLDLDECPSFYIIICFSLPFIMHSFVEHRHILYF